MTIINTSPDRTIQLGYEGEDRVTVLRFRYPYEWLSYGEGVFTVRVRRHGEHTAYNAQLVMDDRENTTLFMTVTNTELSVKGAGEMQVVYSGEDFVKKSPIYSYNVSRAVDEVVDPPAQDVYTQIIESLSDLQTDVQGLSDAVEDIGDISLLTTMAKTDLVSAINEVNEHGGASVTVDDELSMISENPVQNKVVTSAIQGKADTATVSALADAVNGLDSDVQGLQATVQAKADTATVTALSGTVSSLQTTVQGKADKSYVDDAISHVSIDVDSDFSDTSENPIQNKVITTAFTDAMQMLQNLGYTVDDNGIQIALLEQGKADKTTATASSDGLMSAQDKSKLDAVYADYTSALTALGVI